MKFAAALIALVLAVPAGAQAQVFRSQPAAKAKAPKAKAKAKAAKAKSSARARKSRATSEAVNAAPFRLIVKAPGEAIEAELENDEDVVVLIEES